MTRSTRAVRLRVAAAIAAAVVSAGCDGVGCRTIPSGAGGETPDESTGAEEVGRPGDGAPPAVPTASAEAAFAAGEEVFVSPSGSPVGWCDVYEEPGLDSERVAQALIAEPVIAETVSGPWTRVRTADGVSWEGWLRSGEIAPGSARFLSAWTSGARAVVLDAGGIRAAKGPTLPYGAVLPFARAEARTVLAPDGSIVKLPPESFGRWGEVSMSVAIRRAQGFMRAPYQRGANSPVAMDGPGLVQLIHRAAGVALPRSTAALLAAGGEVASGAAAEGDVLFFETFDPDQPQLVVLLAGGASFLEASPASGVNVGLLAQMQKRPVRAIRRYAVPRDGRADGIPAGNAPSSDPSTQRSPEGDPQP